MRKRRYSYAHVKEVLEDLPEIIRDRDILISCAINNAAFPSGGETGSVQSGNKIFQQDRFLQDRFNEFAEELDGAVKDIILRLGFLPAGDVEIAREALFYGVKQEEVGEMFGIDPRQVRRIIRRCCLDSDVVAAVSKNMFVIDKWRKWRGECQAMSLGRFGL